ncbi:MAG: hypothetical protein IPN77_07025 [Sandaracinaceae bacterium]|nr:hypothetical protein [Sandaracinaceae bacterium]
MSPVAQSAQLFLLAGVAFLAIGAVGSAILVGLVRTRLLRCEPRARHRAIVVLAALPVLTALALLTTASLPSLLALFVPGLDHCTAHDDGHAHLCFTHLPVASVHLGVTLSLGFLVGYALLRASLAAARVARALHIVRALTRVGQEQAELGLTIVETAQPVCLAAGFVRPRVLISRGLLESAVWRSTAPRLELVGIAFGARAVERRVEALLAEPLPPTSLRSLTGPLGVALLAVVLHAGELHHATEFLLSAVAH